MTSSKSYSTTEAALTLVLVACAFIIFALWSDGQEKQKAINNLHNQIDKTGENLSSIKAEINSLKSDVDDLESDSNRFDGENWQDVVPDIQTKIMDIVDKCSNLESQIEDASIENEIHLDEDSWEPGSED